MKKFCFLIFCFIISIQYVFSQNDTYIIKIIDKFSLTPIHHAIIKIKHPKLTLFSNDDGIVSFQNNIMKKTLIHITAFGYIDTTLALFSPDLQIIYLAPVIENNAEIVVSATKKSMNLVQAPALVNLLTPKFIENQAGQTLVNIYSKLSGVEYQRSGINNYSLNARGFNKALNGNFLLYIDGRYANYPGAIGLPMNNFSSVIPEDINNIEVIIGPNSALYGPNAHSGVQAITTKSPFKFPGLAVSAAVGSRNSYNLNIRWAKIINSKFAYKITTGYSSSLNFNYTDSVFYGGSNYGLPTLASTEKFINNLNTSFKLDGALHWNIKNDLKLIVSSGYSLNDFQLPSNLGRFQYDDWANFHLQLKVFDNNNYFQINYATADFTGLNINFATRDFYNRLNSRFSSSNPVLQSRFGMLNAADAESFATRKGNTIYDKAKRWIAEYQRTISIVSRNIHIITSINFQKDLPNTFGSLLYDDSVQYENTQLGLGIQFEKKWFQSWHLFLAGRLDYHDKYGILAAPKLGLSYYFKNQSHIRLTYSVANSTPLIVFQNNYGFNLIFGSIYGLTYLPNGGSIKNPNALVNIPKGTYESIQTFELGYKGYLGKVLYIDADIYYSLSKNFLSPAISVPGRLIQYGTRNVPLSNLTFPGTIDTNGILNGANFSTFLNYGKINSYGLDLNIKYNISKNISASIKYSYFNSSITDDNLNNDANRDGYVSLEERSLNVPNHRINGQLYWNSFIFKKLNLEFGFRWLPSYDFYSGNQVAAAQGAGKRGVVYGGINPLNNQPRYYLKNYNHGPLGGFTTFDLSFLYNYNKHTKIVLSINNLLNTTQIENVALGSVDRLIFIELKKYF